MIMISSFLFNLIDFWFVVSILTKLLTLGVLFSTAVRAAVGAKLVITGILFSTSVISALRGAVVAKLVILRISPLTSSILALRVVFSN